MRRATPSSPLPGDAGDAAIQGFEEPDRCPHGDERPGSPRYARDDEGCGSPRPSAVRDDTQARHCEEPQATRQSRGVKDWAVVHMETKGLDRHAAFAMTRYGARVTTQARHYEAPHFPSPSLRGAEGDVAIQGCGGPSRCPHGDERSGSPRGFAPRDDAGCGTPRPSVAHDDAQARHCDKPTATRQSPAPSLRGAQRRGNPVLRRHGDEAR